MKKFISFIISVCVIFNCLTGSFVSAAKEKNINDCEKNEYNNLIVPRFFQEEKYTKNTHDHSLVYFIGYNSFEKEYSLEQMLPTDIRENIKCFYKMTDNMDMVILRNIKNFDYDNFISRIRELSFINFVQKDKKIKKPSFSSGQNISAKNKDMSKLAGVSSVYKVNPKQWYITKSGISDIWNKHSGGVRPITVAVIDTGVYMDHPALKSSLLPYGKDFITYKDYITDEQGHGTEIAGIIAGVWDDEHEFDTINGIASIYGTKILPLKIWGSEDYTYQSCIIKALCYAADVGANIINMSYGAPEIDEAEHEAIKYAHSKGCLLIASSGNEGKKINNYPASFPEVMSIGASTSNNLPAGFSSYSPYVDLIAPGQNIYTTSKDGGYVTVSGTSFSAPFTCALAAVMMSQAPFLSAFHVRNLLTSTADDILLPGRDIYSGFGIIDPADAVSKIATKGAVSKCEYSLDNKYHVQMYLEEKEFSAVTGEIRLESGGVENIEISNATLNQEDMAVEFDFQSKNISSDKIYDIYFKLDRENITGADYDIITKIFLHGVKSKPKQSPPMNLLLDFTKGKYGVIYNTDLSMEYSLDGGYTYKRVYKKDMELLYEDYLRLNPSCGILVRYRETEDSLQSASHCLAFRDVKAPPDVDIYYDNIIWVNEKCEYSNDGENFFTPASDRIKMRNNTALYIRYKAEKDIPASAASAVYFNENGNMSYLRPGYSKIITPVMTYGALDIVSGGGNIEYISSDPINLEIKDENVLCYEAGFYTVTITQPQTGLKSVVGVFVEENKTAFRNDFLFLNVNTSVESMVYNNNDKIALREISSDPNVVSVSDGYFTANRQGTSLISSCDEKKFYKNNMLVVVSNYDWLEFGRGYDSIAVNVQDIDKLISLGGKISLPLLPSGYTLDFILANRQYKKLIENNVYKLELEYGDVTYIFDLRKIDNSYNKSFINFNIKTEREKGKKHCCISEYYITLSDNLVVMPLSSNAYKSVVEYKFVKSAAENVVVKAGKTLDEIYIDYTNSAGVYEFSAFYNQLIIKYNLSVGFSDAQFHWADEYICGLYLKNVVNGYDDGKFYPDENVTRAEFTKMLVLMFDMQREENANVSFKDVKKGEWFYEYIDIAASNKIIEGFDGYFDPDGYIKREDMAVIISRIAENRGINLHTVPFMPNYRDLYEISQYAFDALSLCYIFGIMNGDDDYSVNPHGSATRAECSKVIFSLGALI